MDGQEHRERPEGETGDLGKRGNGWKDWTLGSMKGSGEVESGGQKCLGPGWAAIGRASYSTVQVVRVLESRRRLS